MSAPHITRRVSGLVAAVLVAQAGLTACTEPAAPGEEGGTARDVTVTLKSVLSAAICEEAFTDFDGGEFVWNVSVEWPDKSVGALDATAGFPAPANYQKLQQNQARAVNKSASKRLAGAAGTSFRVIASASEVDFDLFGGNAAADSRMKETTASGVHTFDVSGLLQQGDFQVDVSPTSACQFRAV
jgi:hypothetical protein